MVTFSPLLYVFILSYSHLLQCEVRSIWPLCGGQPTNEPIKTNLPIGHFLLWSSTVWSSFLLLLLSFFSILVMAMHNSWPNWSFVFFIFLSFFLSFYLSFYLYSISIFLMRELLPFPSFYFISWHHSLFVAIRAFVHICRNMDTVHIVGWINCDLS